MIIDRLSSEFLIRQAFNLLADSATRGRHHYRWSAIMAITGLGSTSAQQLCLELGWNPDAPASVDLPLSPEVIV